MSISKYQYYIDIASEEAWKSPMNHKYACIIFKDNKIISIGHNKYNRRTQLSGKYSLHAEMDALCKVKNTALLKGSTLLVVRIDKFKPQTYLSAVPCYECNVRLKKWSEKYGIRNIVWTTDIINNS